MKRIILVLIGFAPLPLGFLTNFFMMYRNFMPRLIIMGILILVAWFIFGMLSTKLVAQRKEAVLLLNTPAILILLSLLLQELILRRFFTNTIGTLVLYFYLPVVSLGNIFARITSVASISGGASVAFVLMLIASYLGRRVAERAKE